MPHRIAFAVALLLSLLADQTSGATLTLTANNVDPTLGTDDCTPATGDASCTTLRGAIDHALTLTDASSKIVFSTSLDGATITLVSFSNDLGSGGTLGTEFGPSAFFLSQLKSITIDASAGASGRPFTHGVTIARDATQPNFRLFDIGIGASLTLRGLTLTGGVAQGGSSRNGGGALGAGGAIFNQGTLIIDRCTLNGNLAQGGYSNIPSLTSGGGAGVGADAPDGPNGGGGPNGAPASGSAGGFGGGGGYGGGPGGFGGGSGATPGGLGSSGGFGGGNCSGTSGYGGAGMGGAVFNDAGSVDIVNSTLYANSANGGYVVGYSSYNGGYGGGIFNYNGTLSIEFSTLSGNVVSGGNVSAIGTPDGGAIYSIGDGNCNNTGASPSGGNICSGTTATLTITSSIAANSSGASRDIATNTINSGHDTPTFLGNLTGTVTLGAFTNAGGFLGVLVPPQGSAAINLAQSCTTNIDERGMVRPDPSSASLASPCDIGAVEANSISDEIFGDGFDP